MSSLKIPEIRTTTTAHQDEVQDAAQLLWTMLYERLLVDESGFKHQMNALDNAVKRNVMLQSLSNQYAGDYIPFSMVSNHSPWHGCKFVASVVMYLLSETTSPLKQDAVRPFNRSLGGCSLPSHEVLSAVRWPYALADAFATASSAARSHGTCTALRIQINDVEVYRHPGMRPGTFAHSCIVTVSAVGVFVFQAYGPRGYTLLQYMEKHDQSFPLSFDEASIWVDNFQKCAGNLGGVWTEAVNAAYDYCFDVDLVALGCMRIGSQLDMHVEVTPYTFDASLIQRNFALLMLPDANSTLVLCSDGLDAKSNKPHPRHVPDGGVRHRYVPEVLRCGKCGAFNAPHSCGKCRKVRYCGKECQVGDWTARHKKVCKSMVTR